MTTDLLRNLAASPHLIDLILLLTIFEAVLILLCRGLSPAATASMLLPGVCLLLAARAALAGASWPWLPAALTGALIAHLLDLRGRWRR